MQNGSFKIKNSIKHKVMCGLVNNINKIVFKYLFWMLYDDQKWKILNASYMYVLKYSKKYHMDYNKISSGLRIRTNRDVEYYNLIQKNADNSSYINNFVFSWKLDKLIFYPCRVIPIHQQRLKV
jgi:hypothetical protein